MKTRINSYLIILSTLLLLSGCSVEYSMIDNSIDADTFSVDLFDEQAANAPAGYGATFTDFLKDFMISRTKLALSNTEADIEISGRIVRYNTSPVSVQSDEVAAANRLTVSVAVTVINNRDEMQSFENTFSQFSDYDSADDLASVEEALLEDINTKLSQDIINKLTSNW